jgi:hypothetical protein
MENKAQSDEKTEEGYHATNYLSAMNIQKNGSSGRDFYLSPVDNPAGERRETAYCRQGTGFLISKVLRELLKSPKRDFYAENPEECRAEAIRIARAEANGEQWLDLSGGIIPKDLVDLNEFQGAVIKAKIPHKSIVSHINGIIENGDFRGYEIQTSEFHPEYITEIEHVPDIYPDEKIIDRTLSEILESDVETTVDIWQKLPRVKN